MKKIWKHLAKEEQSLVYSYQKQYPRSGNFETRSCSYFDDQLKYAKYFEDKEEHIYLFLMYLTELSI